MRMHAGSKSHRQHGSIGSGGTTPARVLPGLKTAGQMGNKRASAKKLEVIYVDVENQALVVKGCVPGKPGGLLEITPVKARGRWGQRYVEPLMGDLSQPYNGDDEPEPADLSNWFNRQKARKENGAAKMALAKDDGGAADAARAQQAGAEAVAADVSGPTAQTFVDPEVEGSAASGESDGETVSSEESEWSEEDDPSGEKGE